MRLESVTFNQAKLVGEGGIIRLHYDHDQTYMRLNGEWYNAITRYRYSDSEMAVITDDWHILFSGRYCTMCGAVEMFNGEEFRCSECSIDSAR